MRSGAVNTWFYLWFGQIRYLRSDHKDRAPDRQIHSEIQNLPPGTSPNGVTKKYGHIERTNPV